MVTPEQPVIIVGAGPCGLLAALVLQRRGVPCIVLERQFQTQHKADVGSGYEIAPTAQKLLERVGLPADDGFWTPFGGMLLQDMHGKTLRRIDGNYTLKVVSRSTLQTRLLQALGWTLDLRFGVEVVDFVQDDGSVTVTLSDGSTITGAALLACDGIHSAVRRALYNSASPPAHISPSLAHAPDHLRFSGINVWWGKCTLHRDSEAYGLVARTQTSRYGSYTLVWCLGSPGHPGTFVGSPVASTDDALVCAWAFCAPADLLPSGVGDDLTCRGAVSGPAAKTDLERHTRGLSPLIRAVVRATDADAVRKVGVHVRERTDLPYAVGRVALLGDAAHPQSPFLGQGVNMALADAYVCAERLARQPVPTALRTYAAAARREAVNALLKQSDWLGATLMSGGWVTTLMVHSLVKRGPVLRWLLLDPEEIDMSNRAMVEEATRELGLDFDPLPAAERPSEWGPGCGAEECTAARQA